MSVRTGCWIGCSVLAPALTMIIELMGEESSVSFRTEAVSTSTNWPDHSLRDLSFSVNWPLLTKHRKW